MYMKNKFTPFTEAVEKQFVDPMTRGDLVVYSVAFTASRLFAMPSAQVENPAEYFRTTYGAELISFVSRVNEYNVFDVSLAKEMARVFWLIRYNALHGYSPFLSRQVDDFFHMAFGIDALLTKEQLATMRGAAIDIFIVADCLARCLISE